MDSQGFYEVTTPCLVPVGAFEACLETLKVPPHGELHTSPEFEMKHLLSEEALPIYQIAPCFRDDPPSPIHLKEFSMLEYYRPGWGYERILDLTKDLFRGLSEESWEFTEWRMVDAVREFTGIDLQNIEDAASLRAQMMKIGMQVGESTEGIEDLFTRILIDKVEPALDPDRPTILRDYPKFQSTLLVVNEKTQLAERFEIYWRGMEICNGGSELNDLRVLLERYENESRLRTAEGKLPHGKPLRLSGAIQKGLPKMAGVAVGLDRLFRCLR